MAASHAVYLLVNVNNKYINYCQVGASAYKVQGMETFDASHAWDKAEHVRKGMQR
jgi:hypothetical protein